MMNKQPITYFSFSLFAILFCMVIIFSIPSKSLGLSIEASNSNSTSNDSAVLTTKGVELNKVGKYNESIVYFDKALAIDPKNALALNEKGNAYGGLGNYMQAIASYDKALALDPKNATVLDKQRCSFLSFRELY
ncbi:MAG: tetratricopeptide repeat protein [Candidatus Nitrosocosmicus sp.]|nr:tetratricopeptide repeat protein [Candidatus Nitrosocosmicus sp.]